MTRHTVARAIAAITVLGFVAFDAAAWGPKAQRAITNTAIQVIRRTYPEAFRTPKTKYNTDVMKGAQAGAGGLRDMIGVNTDDKAIIRIANEVQLLREVKEYEAGSYFCYRMGVLSSLVADMFLPFSFDTSPEARKIKEQIDADIDEVLEGYTFHPSRERTEFILHMRDYFREHRNYFEDATAIIASDYTRGDGYKGYLAAGGSNAFEKAVLAVGDVWYTVLRPEKEERESTPAEESVAWYMIDNIEYLLKTKKNTKQAERMYGFFVKVNPGLFSTYERVGDLFYQTGQRERGVREWGLALSSRGPDRQRIVRKLSKHYITMGRELVDLASRDMDEAEEALQDALNAFNTALQIDRGNEEAVQSIHDTKTTQRERQEREEKNIQIVSNAEHTFEKAKDTTKSRKYKDALALFGRAQDLFENVSDEFPAQRDRAEKGKKSCSTEIRKVILSIVERAQESMEEAGRTIEEATAGADFDKALGMYTAANDLLGFIPEDAGSAQVKQKDELLAQVTERLKAIPDEKKRWEEAEAARIKREEERKAAAAAAAAAARANSDN
jgi:hypothetical protein